jgi:hypothetical protein
MELVNITSEIKNAMSTQVHAIENFKKILIDLQTFNKKS